MPSEALLDPTTLDFGNVLADRAAIRQVNPQRFDMEQLDAIIHLDVAKHMIAGYKDVHGDEFWASGHFPGKPLLPGVLMCEAAAQLCSYYVVSQKVLQFEGVLGFGGLDGVRFRGMVSPGDRLVFIAQGQRLRKQMCVFHVQGFVKSAMVFEGDVIGVPLALVPPPGAGG